MTRAMKQRDVALACGHALEFDAGHLPKTGEVLWCPRCRSVQAQESDCYIAKCQTCRYSRNFGADMMTAQRRAIRHGIRGHVVHVIRGRAIISKHGEIITRKRGRTSFEDTVTGQASFEDIDPPF